MTVTLGGQTWPIRQDPIAISKFEEEHGISILRLEEDITKASYTSLLQLTYKCIVAALQLEDHPEADIPKMDEIYKGCSVAEANEAFRAVFMIEEKPKKKQTVKRGRKGSRTTR